MGGEIRSLESGGLRSNSASNIISHLTAGFQTSRANSFLWLCTFLCKLITCLGQQTGLVLAVLSILLYKNKFVWPLNNLETRQTLSLVSAQLWSCALEPQHLQLGFFFFFPEYFMFTQLVTATFLMRHVDEYIQNRSWLR